MNIYVFLSQNEDYLAKDKEYTLLKLTFFVKDKTF